ncbi:MAG: histidine kinase [Lachnospiraceae bacterium]|nr:histidine kinase [Lachnospiraceae bacterium]
MNKPDAQRRKKIIEITVALSITVFTLLSILVLWMRTDSKELLPEWYNELRIVGEYSTDGGKTFQTYNSIDDVDKFLLRHIIVRGHFNREVLDTEDIYMFINNIEVSVLKNGVHVYDSDPSIVYCWDAIKNTEFKTSDEVTIELKTVNKAVFNKSFNLFFKRLCNSTKAEITLKAIKANSLRILGSIILIVIGASMWVHIIELRMIKTSDANGVFSCGLALMIGGLTCLINPAFITLLMPRYDVLDYLDALTQIHVVLFTFIYFRRYIVTERNKRNAEKTIYISIAVMFIFMITRMFKVEANVAIMVFIMVPGLIIVSYYLIMIGMEYFLQRESENAVSVVGTSILLILTTLAEIFYFLLTGVYMVDAFQVGMIIFGVTQYYVIIKENVAERIRANRAKELENELMMNQISMMMSQIQPHFLYNALGTIRALCTRDPQEARNAMDFFAKYLRANMESINKKECIPFEKELEHVKSYLYIEKLRFGELLNVKYEINAMDFAIPAMTVQTLTENAVKHGLLPKPEGGSVIIRTRETPNCYEIQIEDDGIGFDLTKKFDESRTHVGIENSRQRLASMCNGNLSIGSKIGVGTVITITIPKKSEG